MDNNDNKTLYTEEIITGDDEIIIETKNLNFYYGNKHVLKDINIKIKRNSVTALIGPSGCGKTTTLRCFNRMHDLYKGNRYEGSILFDNKDILKMKDMIDLRSKIGMVFQQPTPFPMSIFNNVAYGLRLKGIKNKAELEDRVEQALKHAALWDEVEGRLKLQASELSGGQQQRLVIARALAVNPEVLLFDEPTSALDPISTSKIEDLVLALQEKLTIIIVTHNMQQAARVSQSVAFMYLGEIIEYHKTDVLFTKPTKKLTEDYVRGRFG